METRYAPRMQVTASSELVPLYREPLETLTPTPMDNDRGTIRDLDAQIRTIEQDIDPRKKRFAHHLRALHNDLLSRFEKVKKTGSEDTEATLFLNETLNLLNTLKALEESFHEAASHSINGCDLLVLQVAPDDTLLEKNSAIQSDSAYIRYNDQLFYANKIHRVISEIKVEKTKLAEFDGLMNRDFEASILSENDLHQIAPIIGHYPALAHIDILLSEQLQAISAYETNCKQEASTTPRMIATIIISAVFAVIGAALGGALGFFAGGFNPLIGLIGVYEGTVVATAIGAALGTLLLGLPAFAACRHLLFTHPFKLTTEKDAIARKARELVNLEYEEKSTILLQSL